MPSQAADKGAVKSGKKLEVEAQKSLTAKDFTTALQKFRSADSLNHTAAAELGQARALVGLGQLAQAQKVYLQLASEAKTLKPAPPAEAAKEAKKLDDRVPHVTVVVSGAAKTAVTVTIDSEPVSSDAMANGTPIAVDPGAHFAHGEAPDMDPVDQQFTVQEGDLETVTLAFHAAAPVAGGPADASAASSSSSGHGGKTRRTVGEVVLVVGAAGLVFGGVTGFLALKKHSSLSSDCPGTICTVSQTSAIEAYHSDANLSTIGFIAGGALAAAGLVLTLLPVHDDPPKDAAPASGAPGASARSNFRFEPLIGLGMVGGRGQF